MDVNAALEELRVVLADTGDMARAHELFDAIDTWLCRGGFLPDDWTWTPTTERHDMTTIALHLPGDAPHLDAFVDTLYEDGLVLRAFDQGDSYREWGEPRRGDDPTHIVLEVEARHAEYVYQEFANVGILVDATLADDWTARVHWGLEDTVPGWTTRYPRSR